MEREVTGVPLVAGQRRGASALSGGQGPTRVAVIGAGRVSAVHLQVLRSLAQVQLVAVCDPLLDRARRAADVAGVEHAVSSVADLCPLDVKVAHVLVPPNLHASVARELLDAGIGAFVEKPLALSSVEARALGALALAKGLPLGVNHNALAVPSFHRLLRRVRQGEIGRVQHVQLVLSIPMDELSQGNFTSWMFRSPRNLLFEIGPHPFAQIAALVGGVRDASTRVLGVRELSPGQNVVDRCVITATAEHGTAELFVALDQSASLKTVRVLGSDGNLEVRLDHELVAGERPTVWHESIDKFVVGWRLGRDLQRDAVRVATRDLRPALHGRADIFATTMRTTIGQFHQAVRSGLPVPVGAEEGARVVEWCEAAASTLPADEVRFPAPPAPDAARPGEAVVIGANGFIGLRTVAALLARGHPVTAVVRRSAGLPHALSAAAADGRVRLFVAHLEDHEALERAVKGATSVLHLATGTFETPEDVERSMVDGSRALARACIAHDVERLVYVSSVSALYLGRDGGYEVIDDDVPVDPRPEQRNLYVQGKIAVERALLAEHRDHGLPLVVARPGIVLGPGGLLKHPGIGEWVRGRHCLGWGPGDRPLPLVLADDIAIALALLVEHPRADLEGRACNLAAAVNLAAAELVTELAGATGRPLTFRPRSYARMRTAQLGKWAVKAAVRQAAQPLPSLRDARSMEHYPMIRSNHARELLGWRPTEDRELFLDRAVRWRAGQEQQSSAAERLADHHA